MARCQATRELNGAVLAKDAEGGEGQERGPPAELLPAGRTELSFSLQGATRVVIGDRIANERAG